MRRDGVRVGAFREQQADYLGGTSLGRQMKRRHAAAVACTCIRTALQQERCKPILTFIQRYHEGCMAHVGHSIESAYSVVR